MDLKNKINYDPLDAHQKASCFDIKTLKIDFILELLLLNIPFHMPT